MRFILLFTLLLTLCFSQSNNTKLEQLSKYKDQNISGWMMSEKLDGIRAFWNGSELLSKKGKPIHAPSYFTINFPPFALDGELYSDKGFHFIQTTVLDKMPSSDWKSIQYHIFETPFSEGNFTTRLEKAKTWFKNNRNLSVVLIPQYICKDKNDLERFFEHIKNRGGEGVVIKDPNLPYSFGRSKQALKLKASWDMEGRVIAINEGRGKYKGLMGSLTIELENGKQFKIGSGFTKDDRQNPPKVGELVTFKYYGFTSKGLPKHAVYMRVRPEGT